MSVQNAPKPLDEVMLAMDVVDTLRRGTRVVEQELDHDGQDKKLLERLKDIYAMQGIDVPDHILREGVEALREDRFAYTPTPASFSRKLAEIYVKRRIWGRPVLWALATLLLLFVIYNAAYIWPQKRAEQQAQLELSQTLPAEFERLYARVDGLTDDQAIEVRASQIRADGFAAIQAREIVDARAQKIKLQDLAEVLSLEYDLRIVSGGNQTSGVWRIPDDNPEARNYYILVEPMAAGKALALDVVNEESNKSAKVAKFGLRVPEYVFQQVLNDKQDDGIIQNNILGTKNRGSIEPNYTIPVLSGVITEW